AEAPPTAVYKAPGKPGSKAAAQPGSKAAAQPGSKATAQPGSKAAGQPGSKAASQPLAAKPAPSTPKGNYAVLVGAAYKNKSEAETVRKDLARKGYSAIVRTAPGGSGYSVITRHSPERKAYTLQEQMKIQGLSNTTVIKVTPVPGPAQKLPQEKPPNGKTGISPDPGR